MSSEPSYPKDAAVSTGSDEINETLRHALTAKAAEASSAEGEKGGGRTRFIVKGAAVGIGSAALVAALLYANRSRRSDKD
jgi:hypothetical protein